jgi:hypothetical protein
VVQHCLLLLRGRQHDSGHKGAKLRAESLPRRAQRAQQAEGDGGQLEAVSPKAPRQEAHGGWQHGAGHQQRRRSQNCQLDNNPPHHTEQEGNVEAGAARCRGQDRHKGKQ